MPIIITLLAPCTSVIDQLLLLLQIEEFSISRNLFSVLTTIAQDAVVIYQNVRRLHDHGSIQTILVPSIEAMLVSRCFDGSLKLHVWLVTSCRN